MATKKKSPRLCDRHKGEAVNFFSLVQERCMCLKCALEMHDSVSEFVAVSEMVPAMKEDGKKMLSDIAALSDATRAINRDQLNQLKKVQTAEKQIRAALRVIRDRLTRHLDVMEQKVIRSVKDVIKKHDEASDRDQQHVAEVDAELKRMRENIQKVMKAGDDIQLVELVLAERENYAKQLKVAKTQERKLAPKVVRFEVTPAVNEFIDNVRDIGDVALVTEDSGEAPLNNYVKETRTANQHNHTRSTASRLSNTLSDTATISGNHYKKQFNKQRNNRYGIHASVHYGVQPPTSRSLPQFESRQEVLDSRIDTHIDTQVVSAEHNGACNLSGVAALSNGRIVVCDSKHKCIQLLNTESELLDDLVFHYKPCDIAKVSGDKVVVSFHDKDFISLFDISNVRITHTRDVAVSGHGGSYSVAFCKNRFAVCRRGEVRIISSDDGTLIRAIQTESHFPQVALSDGGSKIYLSDFVNGKVFCLNELGKIRWEYSHEDFEPSSLGVDLNQLFVADVKGDVSILSTYGLLVRRVFCSGTLQALCVDANTESLFVTLESKDKIKSRTIKILPI